MLFTSDLSACCSRTARFSLKPNQFEQLQWEIFKRIHLISGRKLGLGH